MSETSLKINQKVDLVIKEGSYQGTYQSKVAEINDDNIKVTAPFLRGELVPLRLNLPVELFYTGENAAYYIKTLVIGRTTEPVAMVTLKYPGETKRIQRRQYFRVEVKRDIKYRFLDEDEQPTSEFHETQTSDLSGGGVKMVVDDDFPEEGLVEIYLDLPELDNYPIAGVIVNHYNLPDGSAAGIKFIEIDHIIRDKIIAWLFEYQRKLRKKGLL